MRPVRVFWPRDVTSDGVAVGWLHETAVVVADVVESKDVENVLHDRVYKHEKWLELKEACITPPEVVGQVTFTDSGLPSLTLANGAHSGATITLVFYERLSLYKMRFYSLNALELDITTESSTYSSNAIDKDLLRQETLFNTYRPANAPFPLRTLMNQINASKVVSDALSTPVDKPSAQTQGHSKLPFVLQEISKALMNVSMGTLNLRLSILGSTITFKDVSATAQQMDVRLEQFSFFPSQVALISTRSRRDISLYAAQYINFFNNIWLIFNDVVMGVAAGAIICENHERLAEILYQWTERWSVDSLIHALRWLDDWPVGLKLNTDLSRALSLSFIVLTTLWKNVLVGLSPYFPTMVYTIGLSGYFGLTMMLATSSDTLSLLTIHIYLSYLAATSACHQIIVLAGSLWNLFRGKRYNVLQKRLDSWEYSLDQLLLGTMLFTLVTFLSPTMIVYYALFAAARLMIITVYATMETLLVFMNHFPLFVLMLRIKDPQRLPGGVVFVPTKRTAVASLEVKSVPIPFSGIFFQYLLLWGRLSSHYHPIRLLGHIASATFINPIPRFSIRYSMLPTAALDRRKEKVD
ncbi:related to N-acetylglucosaminyl-phosphatidylinositol biosynthetic protein gpi1 [Serendipita indica DSM 11827]|uniref:Related to N-acetylglucosaminyl-phosphatidylinositol biosynthetic protein gpi1 n=1 Tax=Serendipita indica (strain DSM 11827) TaxID=1109443 RepID=G4TI34_SERID|nr:related to N-acetylglucosaminyl-phosphatidylinositol biosynthetic protein gpi1 [Serendipita indica DSM 11827]